MKVVYATTVLIHNILIPKVSSKSDYTGVATPPRADYKAVDRQCMCQPPCSNARDANFLTFIQEAQWRDTIHFLLSPRATTLAMHEVIAALHIYGARVCQNGFGALTTTHPTQFCNNIVVRFSAMRPSACRHTRSLRHDGSLPSTRGHGLKVTLSIVSYFWLWVIVHFGGQMYQYWRDGDFWERIQAERTLGLAYSGGGRLQDDYSANGIGAYVCLVLYHQHWRMSILYSGVVETQAQKPDQTTALVPHSS